MKQKIEIGKSYEVIGNSTSHYFAIGTVVKVLSKSGKYWRCFGMTSDGVEEEYNLTDDDLKVKALSRKEQAEELNAELVTMDKRRAEINSEIIRLSKFETDEDELAFLLVQASDPNKSEAERCAALAAVLKERTKSAFL